MNETHRVLALLGDLPRATRDRLTDWLAAEREPLGAWTMADLALAAAAVGVVLEVTR